METTEKLHSLLEELLNKMNIEYTKIDVQEEEGQNYTANIETPNPSLLIGYHGETIQALQHIFKVLAWRKLKTENFTVLIDTDNYKKRQEENVINLSKRKIQKLRESGRPQKLPPMSSYFRRKVHLLCMSPGFEDIETQSIGTDENRHIVLKLK